ncbi:MAG: hypothetical protein AAFQ19_16035 [Pseudomonadota bacterium]
MFRPKPGVKQDPARRWALPDRAFFAHGACHILAGVFLAHTPGQGWRAERIIPNGPYPGNHIYVTDGSRAFDYRGCVPRPRLLAWYARHMQAQTPGLSGTIEAVRFDLTDTAALNARKMRGPDQYLHDPRPRAAAFLAQRVPFSVLKKSSPKGPLAKGATAA